MQKLENKIWEMVIYAFSHVSTAHNLLSLIEKCDEVHLKKELHYVKPENRDIQALYAIASSWN